MALKEGIIAASMIGGVCTVDEERREREISLDHLSEADQQYVRDLNRLPTGEAKP